MYCPRCSQQQNSYEVRFCPGCGLQLDSVMELLANNGAPVTRQCEERWRAIRLRRKGVRIGAKLMFLALFLVPVAILMSIGADSPGPFALPFITFLVGLGLALYTCLFAEDRSGLPEMRHSVSSGRGFELPLPQRTPLPGDYSRPIHTAEVVPRPSVTENTTRLL